MANCTALHSMCDQCRITYTKVPRHVDPKHLNCPAGVHSIIFQCTFTGTTNQAREFVNNLKPRLNAMFGKPVPVHATCRRAAKGDKKVGPWYDFTTPPPSPPVGLGSVKFKSKSKQTEPNKMVQIVGRIGLFALPAYEAQQRKKSIKAHSKARDLSILVDFPSALQAGGEIQNTIVNGFPSSVELKEAKHHDGHASLHRLQWWADTHPEIAPT